MNQATKATTTGRVTKLLREKGFGFLREDNGTEYFFHRSAVQEFESLSEGQMVSFTPVQAPKGPRAESVTRVD